MMNVADLNAGSALVWGQGFYTDVTYFTGGDWPGSTANRILHYDLEVSSFPSDLMGHFIPLNLQNIAFPRRLSSLLIADWARAQGAVTGFAHGDAWSAPYTFPPVYSGSVPYELSIDLALGKVDYLGAEFFFASENGQPLDSVYFLWGSLLNSGFRLALTGTSDYPCTDTGGDFTLGRVRTWAYVEGPFTYAN